MLLKSFFSHIFTIMNDESFQDNLEDIENRIKLLDALFHVGSLKIEDISFFNSSPPSSDNKKSLQNTLSKNSDNDDEIVTNLLDNLNVELKGEEIVFNNISNTVAKHAKEYLYEIIKALSINKNSSEIETNLASISEYSSTEKHTVYKLHDFRNMAEGLSMELFSFAQEEIKKEFDFVYDIENIKLFNLIEPVFYRLYTCLNLCSSKVNFYKLKTIRNQITENKIHAFIRFFQRYLDTITHEIYLARTSVLESPGCFKEVIKKANKELDSILKFWFELNPYVSNNLIKKEKLLLKNIVEKYALEALNLFEDISKLKTTISQNSQKECFCILNKLYKLFYCTAKNNENTAYLETIIFTQINFIHFIAFKSGYYINEIMKLLEKVNDFYIGSEFIESFFDALFTERLFEQYKTFFKVFSKFIDDSYKIRYNYTTRRYCLLTVFQSFLEHMENKPLITNSKEYKTSFIEFLGGIINIYQEEELVLSVFIHLVKLSKDTNFSYVKYNRKTILSIIKRFLNYIEQEWEPQYYEICYENGIFEFLVGFIKKEDLTSFSNLKKMSLLGCIINKIEHTNTKINRNDAYKLFAVHLLIDCCLDALTADSDTLERLLKFDFLNFEECLKKLSSMLLDFYKKKFLTESKHDIIEYSTMSFLILNNLFEFYEGLFTKEEKEEFNIFYKMYMATRFELFCDFIKVFNILNNLKEKNIHFENSKLSCIPLRNVFKEKTIIAYTIKNVKENKNILGIANFINTDVFVEIINNYFQNEKKYKTLNEDEIYMCVFACLIDEESLNFDITEFILNLDIKYWQKELSVVDFKETLEGNKYKELGFFNNSLNRLIFYILLISETTKNLEYFENNKLDSDSYTEFLFCKFFDTILSDIEFFQSVANISIGNKLICRIIKFYMNTDGNKAVLFGNIPQKFYDVFICQSTNKYSVVDTATVKVFDYFYLKEYNY